MSREDALAQMELALKALDVAREVGPGGVATHFTGMAQTHALTGILAALAEDARPALAEVLASVGSVLISSDCRDGAHRACAGTGWDDAANRAVECPCECHL